MVEPKLEKVQITTGSPGDDLVVSPQSIPDDTVLVAAGNVMLEDDVTIDNFPGGSIGSFGALTAPDVSRWDLVTLNLTVTPPVLVITAGTPSLSPQPTFDGNIPTVPAGHYPLAAVHVTEQSPNPVIVNSTDIVDVRGFHHKILPTAAVAAYTVGDSADWRSPGSPPTTVGPALDELADRLNQGTAGTTVNATAGAAGTSKDAARNDHVHAHGDLSAVATTHHDAPQVEFVPTTLADWDGASDPGHTGDALDQVAARLNAGTAGQALNATAGAAGTSRNAARDDHVHPHGDLSGVATTHHDAPQVDFTPAVLADWTGSADPGHTGDALDQLASRTTIVENSTGDFQDHIDDHGNLHSELGKFISGGWNAQVVYTTPGSVTFEIAVDTPSGVTEVMIEMWGAGGGGGGGGVSADTLGNGGKGGGESYFEDFGGGNRLIAGGGGGAGGTGQTDGGGGVGVGGDDSGPESAGTGGGQGPIFNQDSAFARIISAPGGTGTARQLSPGSGGGRGGGTGWLFQGFTQMGELLTGVQPGWGGRGGHGNIAGSDAGGSGGGGGAYVVGHRTGLIDNDQFTVNVGAGGAGGAPNGAAEGGAAGGDGKVIIWYKT